MGYKLKKNESTTAGIRRITREEVEEALELLEKKDTDIDETVHEVRKHLKKIRAVVRLVRDELGEKDYRRDNETVRGLGRRLASARDASVRASALDRLRAISESDFPSDRVSAIQKRLVSRRRSALGRLRRGSVLSAIARDLDALSKRVRAWPIRKEGFACLEPGLRRGYRQGRNAASRAYASRADEAFHEWRKRAKDLRYHVDLLEAIWPETMKNVEKTLHDLTDHLGDDHDFAELRRVLTTSPKLTEGADGVATVIELIDRRRSELQASARPIGARIYSEKPRAFARRIESYWKAWRSCPGE
jgi:CHAD domain-containing protein